MNDDLTELASAYLDGDVTSAERAQVESSPELLAEVEQLRLVRGLVGSVEPGPISIREEHLAAALSAWDRLPDVERVAAVRDSTPPGVDAAAAAGASAVTASRPTSLASRRRSRRPWMLAAAAGLVVVLAGGVIINGLTGIDDDDEPASAPAETDAAGDEPASEAEEVAVEAADEFSSANTEAPIRLEEEPAAEPASEADAAEELEVAEAAESPPPEDDVVQLDTPGDLADFAATRGGATVDQSADVPSTEAAAEGGVGGFDVRQCPGIDTVVGLAQYGDEQVVVGIDGDVVIAHRVDDCTEVARAALP